MEALKKDLIRAMRKGDTQGFRELRKENFRLPSFDGETFKRLELSDYDLSGIDFSNTEWDSCILDRVKFDRVNFEGAFFDGCTVIDSLLAPANWSGCAMDGCVLKRVTIAGEVVNEAEFTGTEFEACTLDRLTFADVALNSVTVSGGRISDVRGTGTMTGVVLRDTELSNFDTTEMETQACTANVTPLPDGFKALSGRRKRIV